MIKKLSEIDWQSLKLVKHTPSPSNWEDQVLYFLLLDRFSNNREKEFVAGGDTALFNFAVDNGNAITNAVDASVWQDAGSVWVGGNLKGLQNKMPYLKGLGITTVWISPVLKQVNKEKSYHGYGIQNYLEVDPNFGSNDDLKAVVRAAHEAGIYVILDIILNHSGNVFTYVDQNPGWSGQTYDVKGFNDEQGIPDIPFLNEPVVPPEGAVWPLEFQNPQSFTRKGKINNWDNFPEFLEGDFESLKDIHLGDGDIGNYRPSDALRDLCDAYKYWMAFADLDGFRIDTVKHMDGGAVRYLVSDFHEFAQVIGKDNFYLIGEITGGRANAVDTLDNTGLDAALGIDDIQNMLERAVKGWGPASDYFNLFRNSLLVGKDSHTWFNNKVVTMIDDHDKVSKGNYKMRFCANGFGNLILNAMAFNVTTIGIPCIYYGTEQSFDGQGDSDRYIREAMFGGGFGAFRSKDRHFFDNSAFVYKEFAKILNVRQSNIAIRRGRQYQREISGDGQTFGLPGFFGSSTLIRSIIAWSRIMDQQEVLVAFSNDVENDLTAWITVDDRMHSTGDQFNCLYSSVGPLPALHVVPINGKAVQLTVPKGAFVIYGKG
jgi:glycosidase